MPSRKLVFLTLIASVLIIILTEPAHARKQFSGFSMKGKGSAYKSNNKIMSAGFSIVGAQGTMGNDLADAPMRDMYFYPVQLFVGVRISKIRLAVAAEYMQGSQITLASEVANTNVTGTGISFGPRIDYYDGVQSFGVFYRSSDTYRLEKPDVNAALQEYKSTAGYTVQYTRRIKGRLGFVLDYTQEEFSESLTTGPVKWSRTGFGLIYSNFDTAGGDTR
ncbi:hypothetical protein CIK05_12615 [Bdellovibrio sp. qaytius]|nr:hypothetical protein CIK05_12615 [Bdellovibrio sp. qaytius]